MEGKLEVYLDPKQTSMSELFATIVITFYVLIILAKKLHHRCFTGF